MKKDRRVIIDIIPCVVVTSLETDAFMAIVAYFDMLTVKGNPARVRKEEGTQGSILKEKTVQRLRSNEFYSTEKWRIGDERFGRTHLKFSGCTWCKIEFGDNLEAKSKRVNLMIEFLVRLVLRRNTWWNLTTSRLYQQRSVEFGEKICKLKAEDNYVLFSCEGARDTEDRMFGMDSGASMHNAKQGDLSSDTMDTWRRSKTPQATNRDRRQCK